jgi:beta-glucanase (GH16 family)
MALDLTGFKQTFNDDFNSFSSTPQGNGGWQSTIYGARTLSNNGEQQFYSDSTVGVDPFSAHDGTLTITASPGSNPAGLAYNSGVISTLGDFSQQYGYFEMTAKLPQGAGMWPGFWLLQSDHSWPPELDVLEAFGATNSRGEGGADQAHINVISTVPGESQGNWVNVPGNVYDQFHRYGVDWEPDTITYYIDGQEVGKVATPADMHEPMYMVANLAVGGGWAEHPNGETSSMVIDSIRAYSKDSSAVAVANPSIDGGADTTSAADAIAANPVSAGDPSAPTDATHAQTDTSSASSTDGSTSGTATDHAIASPNVAAGDPATANAGTPNSPADPTATDAHPGTVVADGSTGGTTTADHAASPGVTTLASDTPTNGTVPADSMATDTAHPGTVVADGSTGGTTTDHAGVSGVTQPAGDMSSTNGSTPTDVTATDTAHPGTVVADGSTGGTTTDHAGVSGVTQPAGDMSSTNGSTPADLTATDTAHPGTIVADGSTGGATTDHAGTSGVTPPAGDTSSADGSTATDSSTATTDTLHPGTAADVGSAGTTMDHSLGSPNVTGDASPQATTSSDAATPTTATNGAGTGASMDTGLTLHVSADSWNGDPQFQVFVDGKPAGEVQTTGADHGAGQWQDVTINGDFGAGGHVVDVKFVNDAWNGTTDTDRNLYVQSITMNGVTLAGNEAANNAHHGAWATDPSAAVMQINGDAEFHVPQSMATSDLWTS